jgi:PKD repeat protein
MRGDYRMPSAWITRGNGEHARARSVRSASGAGDLRSAARERSATDPVSYSGGDGNDLTLTAGNIPPQIGTINVSPSSVLVGQRIALSVPESDANQDPLGTTWNFGDGTTASGPSATHVYAKPGSYTATATVSDGLAQVQSSTLIVVAAPPATPLPVGAATKTASSSADGALFSLSAPNACVRKGRPFRVTLSIKKLTKTKARGNVLVSVRKVVFSINAKNVKTLRSAPFRASLTVPGNAKPGSTVTLRARAYFKVRGGKGTTKSITLALKSC